MNLLIVNYEYPPIGGGAATASRSLADALVARGHAVTVLTTGLGADCGRRDEAGVVVERLHAGRSLADRSTTWEMARFAATAWARAPALVTERRVEGVVAFFSVPCGPIARRIQRRLGVPYVVSLRGGDVPGHVPDLRRFHQIVGSWRRRALRDATAVVANSASLAELARRADGVPVEVVPNGVDAAYFTPNAAPTAGPFRFLFVGRLHPQKNPEFVVRAFAALRSKSSAPTTLDVVGDGPQAAELRDLAARLGVGDAVAWHGWMDRSALRDRYRAAHCLVSASPREGMPNAVLEAMACGLAVLASRVPGHVEVVRDGETGFLFTLDAPDEFVAAAQRLIRDDCLRARLAAAARHVAATEYSWDRVAAAYVGFLDRGRAAPERR